MKKITLFFTFVLMLTSIATRTQAQTTYVPDDKFEQRLIDLGYDTAPLDDYVMTAKIATIKSLPLTGCSISNLTGIEDFASLETLYCSGNLLTSLDVSHNLHLINLYCYANHLATLNVGNLTQLESFICNDNQLTTLDVSGCSALRQLKCLKNQFIALDLTNNTLLERLDCSQNDLEMLDMRNGNNANISYVRANYNPALQCILVDDKTASYLSDWVKDDHVLFANDQTDCDAITEINNTTEDNKYTIYPNPTKDRLFINDSTHGIFRIFNSLGQVESSGNYQSLGIDTSMLQEGIYCLQLPEKQLSFLFIVKR